MTAAHLASPLSLFGNADDKGNQGNIRIMRPGPWARFLAVGVEEHLGLPMSALSEKTHGAFCNALRRFRPGTPQPVMCINCRYTSMPYHDYKNRTGRLGCKTELLRALVRVIDRPW